MEIKKVEAALKKVRAQLARAPVYTDSPRAYAALMESFTVPREEAPPTREQWEGLYEVIGKIRALAPWRFIHESERITIILPGREEPIYIVVMGQGEITYGIGIYSGYDALVRLESALDDAVDERDPTITFTQHCINLYFGDREELKLCDRAVIKDLELKFRGRNEWPYFRSMIPGYYPWFLNNEEADLTIQALQHAYMACKAYIEQGLEVDFDDNQTLLRFYDPKADLWYNMPAAMPSAPRIQRRLTIKDDMMTARLKRSNKNPTVLGLIASYIPIPVQENRMERPRLPAITLLVDLGNGQIVDQAVGMGADFFDSSIMNLLMNYVLGHGKPGAIAVCEDVAQSYAQAFCDLLEVQLTKDKRLIRVKKEILNGMAALEE